MSEPIVSTRNEQDNALLLARGYGVVPKAVMQDRRLTPAAKALYAYLCSFAGRGGVAFPGVEKITYDMAMGRQAYYTAMNSLRALGYVRVQRAATAGRFGRNTYTLTHGIAPAPQPEVGELVPDEDIPFTGQDAAEPYAAAPHAETPCAEKPHMEKPHAENPTAENPHANNNNPNNNNPKNNNGNLEEEEDAFSTQTRAHARTGSEKERIVALMVQAAAAVCAENSAPADSAPDAGAPACHGESGEACRLFTHCFGRQPNPAERDGLAGLIAGAQIGALERMMRRAAEHAPHAPLPYLRSVAREYRTHARRLGLLGGSQRLTAQAAERAEFAMDGAMHA